MNLEVPVMSTRLEGKKEPQWNPELEANSGGGRNRGMRSLPYRKYIRRREEEMLPLCRTL